MTTHDDIESLAEALLAHLVPEAENLLRDPDVEEILPFGAVLLPGGRVEALPLEEGASETDGPDARFEALCAAARERIALEPATLAVAVTADVHVVREDIDLHTDAVRFFLEAKSGGALNVFLPYEVNPEGETKAGEIFAVEAEPFLFTR